MSQPAHSAARSPLPYLKYVYILLTASVPFWLGAIGFLIAYTCGVHMLGEELFALAVAVAGTLSAAMVWCVDHIEGRRPTGAYAVTRHGEYVNADRNDIRYTIRSFPPATWTSTINDDTARIPPQADGDGARITSIEAAKAYRFGRVAEKLNPGS